MNVNFKALTPSRREPEYKVNPPLAVSSVGTENTKKWTGNIPYGSALLTGAGSKSKLKNKGINYIIHATPMPGGSDLKLFLEKATKAIQNSIILAERNNIKSLATCLLAGKIFCPDPTFKPPLARSLIEGTLNQLRNCSSLTRVVFVDFDGNYYENAWKEIRDDGKHSDVINKTEVVRGDLRNINKQTHKCEAIVNSENTYMGWGGGISGAISIALEGESGVINGERHRLRDKFNELITEKDEYKCAECGKEYERSNRPPIDGKYCSDKCKNKANQQNDKYICDNCNKEFDDIPTVKNSKNYCSNCKDKVDNDDKDNKTLAEWKEELKKVDNDLGQVFNEDKINEFNSEGKFCRVKEVKALLNVIKDNLQFLNSQNSNTLKEFVSNKSAPEMIKSVERFKFDSLSQFDKEIKKKKIRAYYHLSPNEDLTDSQINEYCYNQAIGKINENEQDPNNTTNPENNILKYLSIGALTLIPLGFLLALFIRKRKK